MRLGEKNQAYVEAVVRTYSSFLLLAFRVRDHFLNSHDLNVFIQGWYSWETLDAFHSKVLEGETRKTISSIKKKAYYTSFFR